jgi:hypothetical protein
VISQFYSNSTLEIIPLKMLLHFFSAVSLFLSTQDVKQFASPLIVLLSHRPRHPLHTLL